jgi:hypothetical protein
MSPAKKAKKAAATVGIEFGKRNYIILGIGLLLIIVGFLFLAGGDITISPILLVVGYCVVIPLGILFPKDKESTGQLGANKDGTVSGGAGTSGS